MKNKNNTEETLICGLHAVMTCFKEFPQLIIRLYFTTSKKKELEKVIKFLSQKKLVFHQVNDEELNRITDSLHHEGVALLIKKPLVPDLMSKLKEKGAGFFVGLENVGNPHNIGAILRSAAHFGAKGLINIGSKKLNYTSTLYRVSEGGAFFVPCFNVENIKELSTLSKKNDYHMIGTSGHSNSGELYKTDLPQRTIIMFGEEKNGLTKSAIDACEILMRIPGTEHVESLNVSVASALFMGEWFRFYCQAKLLPKV